MGRRGRLNESTKFLIDHFFEERKRFDSYEAMGKYHNITPSHIRRFVVTKVAEKYHIPRTELLYYPGRGNFTGNGGVHTIVEPINMVSFWENYNTGLQRMIATREMLHRLQEV